MKKQILGFTLTTLFAAAIVGLPALSRAQDNNAPAAPDQTTNAPVHKAKKHTSSVASGKVSEVDTNAMTLTVGKRTFDITSETRITKAGKPAVLEEIAVGDKVGIAYKNADDGKLSAITVNDKKSGE